MIDEITAFKPGKRPTKRIREAVVRAIELEIDKIAWPRAVWILPDMPKTRLGKILHLVLASISSGRDTGDVTTLANPEIVEEIRRMVLGKPV